MRRRGSCCGGAGDRGRRRRAERAVQGGAAWRGRRRGACAGAGVVEQEWRACGSGGATQEWRRRSGVRARVQGRRRFLEEEENCCVKLTRGARGRVKRKIERAGPPTLSTGRSDGFEKKRRCNHRSNVDRILNEIETWSTGSPEDPPLRHRNIRRASVHRQE